MAVTQVLNALGSFEIEVLPTIPRDILDKVTYFGHIAIVPGRMNPSQYGDNLMSSARYVGVVRYVNLADDGRTNLVEDDMRIGGVGTEFWLGDDDGKGAVIENVINISPPGSSFSSVINLMTPSSIKSGGTIYTVSGSYSGRHQYETPRSAIKYVCDTMSTSSVKVGYRVNNDITLDAGPESNLYVTNPTCVIAMKGVSQGEDMYMRALPTTVDLTQDMEDFATRVVMLAESNGTSVATGTADIGTVSPGTNVYKDINGNALSLTKLVSESDTQEQWADVRAELALRDVISPNRAISLTTDDYDIFGTFNVGDYVWVYDPDGGVFDTNNEVYVRGVRMNPMKLQVTEADWPIVEGYTVAYRDSNGVWIDLTDYIHWEESSNTTKVVVGDFSRTLTSNAQSVDTRLGTLTQPDLVAPAAPTWNTPFTGSTYLDGQSNARARVTLSWNTPLNQDSTTVTDGDRYEINYRQTGQTDWDVLYVTWGTNTLLLSDLPVATGYDVRIRGIDVGSNLGAWSTTATFTTTSDTIAPSTPAAPAIAASLLAVQMTHTLGKASGGTYNLESDLAYLELHKGTTSGFTTSSSTLLGTVRANQGMMTATTPVVATFDVSDTTAQWYKVIAVDISGNKSNASAGASATATLVDDSHISNLTVSKVTAGTISANWLLSSNIQTAATGARVALTSTGLQAYDSAGNNTVTITNDGTFSAKSPPSQAAVPVIEWVGISPVWNQTTGGSGVQINRPENVTVGDLMLAFVETNSQTTSPTITMSGWTQVGSTIKANHGTANDDTNLFVLKRNFAQDDPDYWNGTTTVSGAAQVIQTVVIAYRGADVAANQFGGTPVTNTTISAGTTIGTGSATNSTTGAWRLTCFAGLDTTSGGSWSTSQSGDFERNDTEAGSASPFMTLALYDSGGSVALTSQSATGTFANSFVSAVAWQAYLKPLPQASSQSSIQIDSAGIRAYNQVGSQTLNIQAATGGIDMQGSLESFNYIEGADGWRVDGNGSAQFENINVINTIGATNGSFDTSLQLGGVDVATEDFYKIKFPCVRVARETSGTVSASTSTASTINWDTKYFERNTAENSMFDSTTATRLKAPVDGIYNLSYNIHTFWSGTLPTGNGASAILVQKNGGGVYGTGITVSETSGWMSNANGNWALQSASTDVALSAGDYLEFFSIPTGSTGSTRNLATNVGACVASLRYVAPLDGPGVGGSNIFIASFPCTACRTFQGTNVERPPNIGDWAYQGQYDGNYGNQRSMLMFDYSSIQSTLSGKTILSCTLRYHITHSYYSSMDVTVGTHNNTNELTWPGAGGVTPNRKLYINQAEGSSYTQSLGTTIGGEFQAGTTKGIVFGPGQDTSFHYYGYLVGYQPSNPTQIPILTFTYQ